MKTYCNKLIFSALIITVSLAHSCKQDQPIPDPNSGYPPLIGSIMKGQCATTGCHDEVSKEAAAGLSLETWDKLFEGSRNNAAVVPYSANQSFLMFFINSYSDLGPSIVPTMPYSGNKLSKDDVIMVRDWIEEGAPNSAGEIAFSGDPNRKKIYVINQGCDNVAVLDYESLMIMRYFDIGASPTIESPHKTKISKDGLYYYVCFYAGDYLEKYSTVDESLIGRANIGFGSWNTFTITSDGKTAFVVNLDASGSIAVVDLETMTLITKYQGSSLLVWPHGSTLRGDTTLYITAQTGNFLYKIDISDIYNPEFSEVVMVPGESPSGVSAEDPHDIHFNPDKSEYAVTCQGTNEVRFFDAITDSLVAVVPIGEFPQEVEFSKTTDYVFITCMEDNSTFPGKIGSVSIVNYRTHTFIKSLYTGYQPHGVEPDDEKGLVYVANRNASTGGPAPHHTTECGGRNGYLTLIDMNTLELVPGFRAELSVDPYYISIKE